MISPVSSSDQLEWFSIQVGITALFEKWVNLESREWKFGLLCVWQMLTDKIVRHCSSLLSVCIFIFNQRPIEKTSLHSKRNVINSAFIFKMFFLSTQLTLLFIYNRLKQCKITKSSQLSLTRYILYSEALR